MIDDLCKKAGWEVVTNQHKKPFLEVKSNNKTDYYPLSSEAVKNLILGFIYKDKGVAPSRNEREKIYDALAAKAQFSGKKETIWHRTAKAKDGLEIDLNNSEGTCVAITEDKWCVKPATSPFMRPQTMKELPTPTNGATWDIFKKHFKTKTDDDLKLIIGFMLSCLRPCGPYPILVLQGEQGSAKSTTTRWIKSLIDPAVGSTRGLIRKEQDLFIAAQNNHLLSFDNVSVIQNDVSDTLCRLATGAAFSARTLYSNEGETLLELCKPVLLNGITDFVNRADLYDRSIIVELAPIEPSQRKTLESLDRDFFSDLPEMLGVLMSGIVSALKNQKDVQLKDLSRMADTIVWCSAAEKGLGWAEGSFYEAFERNKLNGVLNNLSNDPVAIALRSSALNWIENQWIGGATELLAELNRHKPLLEFSKSWPTTPTYLSQYFSRNAQNLRKIGIDFVGRDRNSYVRSLILRKTKDFEKFNQELIQKSPMSDPKDYNWDED